jgi:hypothetical protein
MSYPEALQAALERGAFGGLAEQYLHRARRETSLGMAVGRDEILAEDLKLAAGLAANAKVRVAWPTPSLCVLDVDGPDGSHQRQHRWLTREGALIARETVVGSLLGVSEQDLQESAGRAPVHLPLGEVRSGRGQLRAGAQSWFRDGPVWLLDALHRIWNGRCLDEIDRLYAPTARWSGPDAQAGGPDLFKSWAMRLLARHPDATLLFERSEQAGDRIALLWRLVVHQHGKRAHVLGSSLLTIDGESILTDDTLLDVEALEILPHRPLLAIAR